MKMHNRTQAKKEFVARSEAAQQQQGGGAKNESSGGVSQTSGNVDVGDTGNTEGAFDGTVLRGGKFIRLFYSDEKMEAELASVKQTNGDGSGQEGIVTSREIKGVPVDENGQVITNPAVRDNLNKLAYGLDAEGYTDATVVATGGSSKWDAELRASVSMVDGSVISGRGKSSAHNLINGARDVDIRGSALNGIDEAAFNKIVTKYTDFNRVSDFGDYSDGHIHLGLPRSYSCYSPEGC